jgi:hypothetical protein
MIILEHEELSRVNTGDNTTDPLPAMAEKEPSAIFIF